MTTTGRTASRWDIATGDDSSEDGNSVTTTEAMAEMLGLPVSCFVVASSSSYDHDDDDGGGPDARDRDDDDENDEDMIAKCDSRVDGMDGGGEGPGVAAGTTVAGGVGAEGEGEGANVVASRRPPRVTSILVPRKCSRFDHHPRDVTAFAIRDFLTVEECRSLIRLASSSSPGNSSRIPSSSSSSASSDSDSAFRYVREAIHVDDDGMSHVITLPDGTNRHKLRVFEHDDTVRELWKRMETAIFPHVASFARHVDCGLPVGLNPRLRILKYDAIDDDVFDAHFDATTRVRGRTGRMGGKGGTTTATTATTTEDGDDDAGIRTTTGDRSSLLTVLIYLNDGGGMDFDGGETRFVNRDYDDRPNRIRRRCGANVVGCGAIEHSSTSSSRLARERETIITPEAGKVVVFEHDLFHLSSPLTFGTKYVLRTDVLFDVVSIDNVGRTRMRREYDDDLPSSSSSKTNATNTNTNTNTTKMPRTLLDVCRDLSLPEEDLRGLDEIGLLHTTLDALLAPGVRAVREVLSDVVVGRIVERIIRAALESRRDNCRGALNSI